MLGDLYKLIQITDNGDGVMASIGFKGNVSTTTIDVACKDLYMNYMPEKSKLPENAKYPSDSASSSPAWKVDQCTKQISIGLASAASHYGDMNVLCRESPSRKVFALQDYKKGELILVPTTLKIKAMKTSKGKVCENFLENLLRCASDGDTPSGYSFHLCPMSGDIVCPVWYLTNTDKSKEANLKVSMIEVAVGATVGVKKSTMNALAKLTLPVFTNSRAVKDGDELMYYKPPKDEKEKVSNKRPFDAL